MLIVQNTKSWTMFSSSENFLSDLICCLSTQGSPLLISFTNVLTKDKLNTGLMPNKEWSQYFCTIKREWLIDHCQSVSTNPLTLMSDQTEYFSLGVSKNTEQKSDEIKRVNVFLWPLLWHPPCQVLSSPVSVASQLAPWTQLGKNLRQP